MLNEERGRCRGWRRARVCMYIPTIIYILHFILFYILHCTKDIRHTYMNFVARARTRMPVFSGDDVASIPQPGIGSGAPACSGSRRRRRLSAALAARPPACLANLPPSFPSQQGVNRNEIRQGGASGVCLWVHTCSEEEKPNGPSIVCAN